MTFMTLLSLVGRLGSGFLGDIIDKRYIVAAALCLQSLGMIIFANVQQPWHLIPFLLVYGPSYGGTIPIRPAIIADYFGRRNFGAIQGLMMGIAMLGGIASPVIGGWVFDVTGSYRSIFIIYAGLAAIGIPAILTASRPRLIKNKGE
jgi:MFS family permease